MPCSEERRALLGSDADRRPCCRHCDHGTDETSHGASCADCEKETHDA